MSLYGLKNNASALKASTCWAAEFVRKCLSFFCEFCSLDFDISSRHIFLSRKNQKCLLNFSVPAEFDKIFSTFKSAYLMWSCCLECRKCSNWKVLNCHMHSVRNTLTPALTAVRNPAVPPTAAPDEQRGLMSDRNFFLQTRSWTVSSQKTETCSVFSQLSL